jgi:small subunit ribosomal protein S21
MAHITVGTDESLDRALKRFKKAVDKEGIISEFKSREFYEKPSIKRHRDKVSAKRRNQRDKN